MDYGCRMLTKVFRWIPVMQFEHQIEMSLGGQLQIVIWCKHFRNSNNYKIIIMNKFIKKYFGE